MIVQFVDTYYLLALVNPRDKDHSKAVDRSRGQVGRLLTTTWVLVEFADALSAANLRSRAAHFIRGFEGKVLLKWFHPLTSNFSKHSRSTSNAQTKTGH